MPPHGGGGAEHTGRRGTPLLRRAAGPNTIQAILWVRIGYLTS